MRFLNFLNLLGSKGIFSPGTGPPLLEDLFADHPKFRLTLGNTDIYRQFRSREPHLVSIVDELPKSQLLLADVLVLHWGGAAIGAASFALQANPQKRERRRRYARIDLVIVPPGFRGVGVGKLLLLAVVTHLLRAHGPSLYSISCLAAHPAVGDVLEGCGFAATPRDHLHYVHEELKLADPEAERLAMEMSDRIRPVLQIVKFRLRQRAKDPAP